MKLAVVGSRNFKSKERVFKVLDYIHSKREITEIISGGAKGVDSWAKEWALKNKIKVKEFIPDWGDLSHPDALVRINKFGKEYDSKAGIRRNSLIVNSSDRLIAFLFNKSNGTMDSIRKAKKQNKLIKVIE